MPKWVVTHFLTDNEDDKALIDLIVKEISIDKHNKELSTNTLKAFDTYEDASEVFEDIKVIKDKPEVLPIGLLAIGEVIKEPSKVKEGKITIHECSHNDNPLFRTPCNVHEEY